MSAELIDVEDGEFKALVGFSSRVLNLLGPIGSRAERNPHFIGTLDEFLGVIYALIFAKQHKFKYRTTGSIEIDAIRRRARAVAKGDVRTIGPWMAGFHFNAAILRLAAVYHRGLKVALCVPLGNDGYAARKLDQYSAQKVSHLEGGSFYADRRRQN